MTSHYICLLFATLPLARVVTSPHTQGRLSLSEYQPQGAEAPAPGVDTCLAGLAGR